MIVGFTIVDVEGHEEELSSFIKKVCILEYAEIADNIVAAGNGVNVFTKGLDDSMVDDNWILATGSRSVLESYPPNIADYIDLISTREGYQLVASAVNFNLELIYNGKILRLVPTEYIYILPREIPQFDEYERQGLIRFIPYRMNHSEWILADGTWNDNGKWVDTDFWRDSL